MKIFVQISLLVSLFFCLSLSAYSSDTEYDYDTIVHELREVESELRTKVSKWPSYIRQLGSILPTLQSDQEQLDKIFTRMEMLREPERFENMSSGAQILINYIYFKILFLTTEPEVVEDNILSEPVIAWATELSSFEEYGATWLEELDVKISQKWFTTVYFNTDTWVKSYPFTLASLSLTGSGMSQDIAESEDAWVYMAWNIHIEQDGGYEFSFTQNGWQVEIILDGYLIIDTEGDLDVFVELEAWTYLIELQYVNTSDELDFTLDVGL